MHDNLDAWEQWFVHLDPYQLEGVSMNAQVQIMLLIERDNFSILDHALAILE